ncbi:MAG: sporulation protein YqfD [Bacillota bacterium]
MLVNRLVALLCGYLAIRFRGVRVERLINLCLAQGIPIWDIYTTKNGTVVGKTSIDGFRRMRSVVRKSGVRVHIIKRRGLPFFVHKLWQRSAFAAGALLFILGLYLMGSVIWFVEVKGTEELPPSRVLQAAAQLGVRPGAWRGRLLPAELSRQLVLLVPELSWAGVELQGSRATIEVVEKKLVTVQPKPIGDVVALKGGVIKKIVPMNGQAAVKAGDTVQPGQVLINGCFQVDDDTEKRYVHAEGIVTARVWYEGNGTSALRRLTSRPTGNTLTREVLIISGREIVLRGPAEIPFALYEVDRQSLPLIWRNLGAAVEHIVETYSELMEEYEQVSFSEAQQEALEMARQEATAKLPPDATIEDEIIQAELLEDQNTVRVRLVVETTEAIGGFREMADPPIQGGYQ